MAASDRKRSNGAREAEAAYRAAAHRIALGAAAGALREATLAALVRLNAVYYLGELLPESIRAAAVTRAADAVKAASSGAGRDGDTDPERADECAGVTSQLLLVVHAQHLLEILPVLGADERSALSGAARGLLARLEPASPRALRAETWSWLSRAARCNDRPPREGELAAWTALVARRPARSTLEQALASALHFASLEDALVLAAARGATSLPADDAALRLAAAHAVRRLGELTGEPALEAWLSVADALRGVRAAPNRSGTTAPSLRDLAIEAVSRRDPAAVQAVEAVVAELEALPSEAHPALLAALGAILTARWEEAALPAIAGPEDQT